jgi:hypothetical protein
MRVGHKVEIQRIYRGDPRNDADLFDPQKHEHSPKYIQQLHRKEQDPQRNRLLPCFRRQAWSVVTDKHLDTPLR